MMPHDQMKLYTVLL